MVRRVKREAAAASSSKENLVDLERRRRVNSENEGWAHQRPDERRVLRSKYLALHNKINDERDDLTKVDSDKFDSIIKEVEDLHKRVQKPREQVADAEALLGLANTLVTSVKSQSNEGITPSDFVSCLLSAFGQINGRLGNNEENAPVVMKWKEIGLAVSPTFRRCSGFSTMVGPMKTELKQRKAVVHRRQARTTEATAQPEEIEENGAEEKTDTDKNMSTMFEILKREKRVRLENLILIRGSFAQTVENLFALSFLVKDGRVEINVDKSGAHFVSPRNAPSADSVMKGEVTYRHFVFRFDFKDWKLMMEAVPEGDELMPHRESSDASQMEPAANNTQQMHRKTPIRKLSRNRGLVVQENTVVEDSPEIDGAAPGVTGIRRCRRRLN